MGMMKYLLDTNVLSETPPFVDGQIASIAKVNGLILVTKNIKDYRSFSRLKTENWHKA
jgi:tRNA(fMet)-specific endonuclease VapC